MEDEALMIFGHFGDNHEDSSDSDDDGNGDIENDVVPDYPEEEQSESETSSEDDDNDGNDAASNINFDKSLPGTHSYLGDDLEDIQGRTVHEAETVITLPLLYVPGLVLCPGQTVPLQLFESRIVAMMQRVVNDGDNTFGVVAYSRSGPRSWQSRAQILEIGTTAEVLAFKLEDDDSSGIQNIRIKAIGRQRFKIKETRRAIDGTIMGHVTILPEHVLPDPFLSIRPCIHTRPSIAPVTGSRKNRISKYSSANLTHWPAWVYKQYDAEHLMAKVRKELVGWNLRDGAVGENGVGLPQGPIELSHWLAANLPLDDVLRSQLLAINCAVQRLRAEISIMQRCTALCCRQCNLLIANKNDVFSMSLEGPMGAYVNPGGFVHETLTVTKAQNLHLIGSPSTENSWFPGYAWTILNCRGCHQHMGWRFTATRRSLRPQKFWGITRSGLMPGLLVNKPRGEGRDSGDGGSRGRSRSSGGDGGRSSRSSGGGDGDMGDDVVSVVGEDERQEDEEEENMHWRPVM